MDKLTIAPDGAVLYSIANANLKWATVLGEWIDNAFDAGARTISIEFQKDAVRVADDGRGCARPTDMIRLGAHAKHASTRLGRYGIGGKEAAIWVGAIPRRSEADAIDSNVTIRTVHDGRVLTLFVNWKDFAKAWEVTPPNIVSASALDAGTVIVVSPARKPPAGEHWQNLLAELSYWYTPAIKHGRQIKFKRPTKGAEWEPLTRWELPEFQGEIVNERIEVHGRGARVYCGVVKDGVANPRPGFTYLHEWRVIEPYSSKGCGRFNPGKMCGFVELDASWPLRKNKDGVSKDADELYAAVEHAALPILERADVIGTTILSRRFEVEVNERLNAMLATHRSRARAKRSAKVEKGTVQPTETGVKHTRAAQEQSGDTFDSRRGDGGAFKVVYANLGTADVVGKVSQPNVILNRDNPVVEQARRDNETMATVILAACLIGAEKCFAPENQTLLRGIMAEATPEGFSKAVGSILSAELSIDGKPALRAAS